MGGDKPMDPELAAVLASELAAGKTEDDKPVKKVPEVSSTISQEEADKSAKREASIARWKQEHPPADDRKPGLWTDASRRAASAEQTSETPTLDEVKKAIKEKMGLEFGVGYSLKEVVKGEGLYILTFKKNRNKALRGTLKEIMGKLE